VSDFLSRLIARSSGEKSLVRPRITPAFSKTTDTAERNTAGEILHNLPERLPAVAPLPFDAPRQNRKQPQQSSNLHSQETDTRLPLQTTLPSPDMPQPLELREEREERVYKHNEVRQETTVVAPIASVVTGPEDTDRQFVEARKASPSGTQDTPVLNVVQEFKTWRKDLPAELVVPANQPQSPIFPARPPAARTTELSNEASKIKKPSEPAIHVTIGKIEVRAALAPQKSAEKKTPRGVMSLEEYQRLRNRRSAG
jgi:hypothetical protein